MPVDRLCKSTGELEILAEELLDAWPGKRIFAFLGEMGAGKTTFIKAICKKLGVKETVNSPTFSLVNEYKTLSGESVFHFDFYRIKKPEELMDIGIEDYLYGGSWCLIEWPEKAIELLPGNCVYIRIEDRGPDGSRNFHF